MLLQQLKPHSRGCFNGASVKTWAELKLGIDGRFSLGAGTMAAMGGIVSIGYTSFRVATLVASTNPLITSLLKKIWTFMIDMPLLSSTSFVFIDT